MPAYVFPLEHAAALDADRQRLVFPAPRNPASTAPHAELDQTVYRSIAKRGDRPARSLAPRICILRATLVLAPDALVRVIDLRCRDHGSHADAAAILARHVRAAENGRPGDLAAARDTLAALAGFATWAAACAYCDAHRGRPDADGRLTRELIGWSEA